MEKLKQRLEKATLLMPGPLKENIGARIPFWEAPGSGYMSNSK